jgi:predicted ester cyclase
VPFFNTAGRNHAGFSLHSHPALSRPEAKFESKIRSAKSISSRYLRQVAKIVSDSLSNQREDVQMSRILDRRNALKMGQLATVGVGALSCRAEASTGLQSLNEAVVGRWFTEFWGKTYNPAVVDELATPDMLLKYSLHKPRHGREDIKAFMHGFRAAFPGLNFWGTAPLLADGDYVIGQWEGGGTHTGPAFSDFLVDSLPANSGRKMHFTEVTILKLKGGKIVQEIGLDAVQPR